MGLIGRVMDFIKSQRNNAQIDDIVVQAGGNFNVTAEQYLSIDKQPLKTDYVALIKDTGNGRYMVVGCVDPINQSITEVGEEALRGRSSGGSILCKIIAKNDGSVIIDNNNGSFQMQADGSFNINGVIIDIQGNITSPSSISGVNVSATTSMNANGKELINHTHPAGTPPNNTGVNN